VACSRTIGAAVAELEHERLDGDARVDVVIAHERGHLVTGQPLNDRDQLRGDRALVGVTHLKHRVNIGPLHTLLAAQARCTS
jgi:hypothetical protein